MPIDPLLQEWLQHAPAPVDLATGKRYHIFISYRSSDRAWVIQLYDVLKLLNYEVFLDRFVLPAGDELPESLNQGISESVSAILVWSKHFATSAWCKKELNALVTQETNDSSFRYVIATLDETPLQPLLAPAIRVSFSASPDGPSGKGIMELANGLINRPLPPGAVHLLTQCDQAVAAASVSIKAKRAIGDADGLIDLANTNDLAWKATPALGAEVADALIGLKRLPEALAVLATLEAAFPRSLRVKQLKGLALARSGDLKQASLAVGELQEAGHVDPETTGILARTWMDRYKTSRSVLHLRKSRDLYMEAFEATPTSYYNGINAASKSLFLGEATTSKTLATKVEALVGTQATKGDYWKSATAAEVQLLLERFDAAALLYDKAVAIDPEGVGNHESTRDQAVLILDALKADDATRAKVLAAFAHL